MLALTNHSKHMKTLADLRSRRWFDDQGMRGFAHRQRMQQQGMRREDIMGKPMIAILNTWSDLSPCHAHLRERAESVKKGILMAGGYPVELPAMSLGEVMVKPTTMLYRNFLAMEVAQLALRWRGAHGWLRQDDARPADGRDQHEYPCYFLPRRPDAQ
jgi:dihydroxyacid dehydratase/phosphogluconate dehydratase